MKEPSEEFKNNYFKDVKENLPEKYYNVINELEKLGFLTVNLNSKKN